MLSAILLKMATISWSEIVCCAMVEFQKELFEANTRCKTGFGTKMLDPSSVAFYSFFRRAQEESLCRVARVESSLFI